MAFIALNRSDTHEAFRLHLVERPQNKDTAGKGISWSNRIFETLKLLIKLMMCAKYIDDNGEQGTGHVGCLLPRELSIQFKFMDRTQLLGTAMYTQLSRYFPSTSS